MADIADINKRVDIEMLLEKLGADSCNIKRIKPLDYRCNAWWRGGDNPHGLGISYDKNKNKWLCTDFTHRQFGNSDIFDFVTHVTGLEFKQAMKLVESCCVGSNCVADINTLINEQNTNLTRCMVLERHILDCFNYGLHPYLYKRGYTKETAKYFQLGYSNINILQDRIIIPIFNENNELVSVQGRTFENEEPKYMFIEGTGDNAKRTLYNYTNAVEVAKSKGWILVVEGATSCWRLHQYGIDNVVATLSTSVTDQQVKLLTKLGLKIVIFFDSDENNAGLYGTNKLARKLKNNDVKNGVYMANLAYQKLFGSPDDATKEQIYIALKKMKKLF